MPTETATYIDELDETKPAGSESPSEGDDHLRLIKDVLKNTLPNLSGAMTKTDSELNNVRPVGGLRVSISGAAISAQDDFVIAMTAVRDSLGTYTITHSLGSLDTVLSVVARYTGTIFVRYTAKDVNSYTIAFNDSSGAAVDPVQFECILVDFS